MALAAAEVQRPARGSAARAFCASTGAQPHTRVSAAAAARKNCRFCVDVMILNINTADAPDRGEKATCDIATIKAIAA